MDAGDVIRVLGLEPHAGEGGYFRETYRSGGCIPASALPEGYLGGRAFGTAIYYLITPESFSALHRVRGDELFHFYLGDPVDMLRLFPDSSGEELILGSDIMAGHLLQCQVPGGVWQGLRLADGGRFALLGTTMAPGFEYEDFELGDPEWLMAGFPALRDRIARFVR